MKGRRWFKWVFNLHANSLIEREGRGRSLGSGGRRRRRKPATTFPMGLSSRSGYRVQPKTFPLMCEIRPKCNKPGEYSNNKNTALGGYGGRYFCFQTLFWKTKQVSLLEKQLFHYTLLMTGSLLHFSIPTLDCSQSSPSQGPQRPQVFNHIHSGTFPQTPQPFSELQCLSPVEDFLVFQHI